MIEDGPEVMFSELERKLIAYAHDLRFDEIPVEALHQTKRRILDTLGGALAAYHAPTSRIARRIAQPVGEGPAARIWEDSERGPRDLEIESKFSSLTNKVLSDKAQRALIDCVERIESLDNVGELIDLTQIETEDA